jgi:dihydrofolate reductase
MNCIVAVDNNFAIGKNNNLLFHIPADLKSFKKATTGKIVVMGKNTLLSFPNKQPLPNRTNIVLSTTLNRQDCIICHSLASLWKLLKNYNSDDIFIIGGELIYKELLPYCSKAYITKILTTGKGNKFFPNIDKMDNWQLISQSSKQNYEGLDYYFCQYENKNVLLPENI